MSVNEVNSKMGSWEFLLRLAQWVKNLTSNHEDWVQSLASLSGLRNQHCRELWHGPQMWLGSCVAVAVA